MNIGLGYAEHCQSRWERERRPGKIFVLSIHFTEKSLSMKTFVKHLKRTFL
jgi:hypothetical protein